MLALVALLVRIRLGFSVLFCQVCPGLRGEPFTIYKFRTMTDVWDAEGKLLLVAQFPDEQGRRRLISGEMCV